MIIKTLLSGLMALALASSASAQSRLITPPVKPAPIDAAPALRVTRASITSYDGYVEIERKTTGARDAVSRTPANMIPGDKVHTGKGGRATVLFRDGSKIVLGPYAIFTVEAETLNETTIFLAVGKLWAAVSKNAGRRFSVRTPTAVAAVRGTEFSVETQSDRATAVEVFGGLVSVRGALGGESMISASQRVDVTEGRMGQVEGFTPHPESVPEAIRPAILGPSAGGDGDAKDQRGHNSQNEPSEDGKPQERGAHDGSGGDSDGDSSDGSGGGRRVAFDRERFKDFVEHQAGEQERRDQRESSAIFEHKAEIFQDGKTLIDAFGRRVRVEEYLLRPSADSFRFVSLNFRDNRTDLASIEVTANQALPERLSDAGNLWFSPNFPSFWAVKQRLTMTNGVDIVSELGVDGKPQPFTAPTFDANGVPSSSPIVIFHRTMFGNKYEFINGNPGAIDRIWNDATFRPGDNDPATNVTGMMWRTQPVQVNIVNIDNISRGQYWTDVFVAKTLGSDGLAFAQTTFQPTPGAAHFLSMRSYFNFKDTNNNGILDFGEQTDPFDPNFFHDVIARMDGTTSIIDQGAGSRQTPGDTFIYSDRDKSGAFTTGTNGDPFAQIDYTSFPPPLQQALNFAQQNPRDFLVAEEFAIDDFGTVLPAGGSFNDSTGLFFSANFERRLRSSLFSGPDIDVVMSPGFIFQSGVSNAEHQDRPVPSPGPKF